MTRVKFLDDSFHCRAEVRRVNYKKTIISQINHVQNLCDMYDMPHYRTREQQRQTTRNIHRKTEKINYKHDLKYTKDVKRKYAKNNREKKVEDDYKLPYSSSIVQNEGVEGNLKVKNKNPQDEEELVNDINDNTNVDYEDEGDKGKGGNNIKEDEEKEEERRENEVTNDVEDEDIKKRAIKNYSGKRTANKTNEHENMEEESREIQMQPSGGDRNNNDDYRTEGRVDENCWCIKRPGPESQDSNDEIKLSVIKKVFLTRLKKNSSTTSPNENTYYKTNKRRKKTSLESIEFDNHKSEDNLMHKTLRKEQYTTQTEQLKSKEYDNFKKSDKEIRSKHSYQNETSEHNLVKGTTNDISKREKSYLTPNYLKTSHSEKSEIGQLKRKFLEDDANKSLNKKTKYDGHNGKLLQHGPVSEIYGKLNSEKEIENEFSDSEKRTPKNNEAYGKTIKKIENYFEKKQSVKHQWVINTRSQSQSNQKSSKHEATRLVLKKLKSTSNEPLKTHTHESSINNTKKEKYSMQKGTKEMLPNSSNKTKRDVKDQIEKSSKHAVSSNGTETRKTTIDTQQLDKKAQFNQNRTARQVVPESISSITTRHSDRNATSRSNNLSSTKETKTSYTLRKTNTIWTPDNFLLLENPEKKHATIKHKLNTTDRKLQKVDIRNITSDQPDDIIAHESKSSKKYNCSKSSTNKSPVVVLKDIFSSESRSRTKTAHNLEVSCAETKTSEHGLSKIHLAAHIQSKTPCKARVKDCTQTSSSSETSKKTIPATNKQTSKNALNDLKSDKRDSNHHKTSSVSSNHLKKPCNLKKHITGNPQNRQTKFSTSKNVKDNKNTEQRKCLNTFENECYPNPSLKVSISLSALSNDWLEDNVMHIYTPTTDQTSSHGKNTNSKHNNSILASNKLVDLSKQSLGTDSVPYSETDQFNKMAKDSKLRIIKTGTCGVSIINHTKGNQQRRLISHYANSTKSKMCEGTRISGPNFNVSEIATQEDNTKTPSRGQPKKKRLHIRKSTTNDDNSRSCNKKAFQSGNKTNFNTLPSLSGYSVQKIVLVCERRIKSNKKLTRVLPTRYKATNNSVIIKMSKADKQRKSIYKKSKNEMKTYRPEVKFADKDDVVHSLGIESPQNVTNRRLDDENDKMEICEKDGKLGVHGKHQSGIISENPQNVTNEIPDEETDKMEICEKEGKLGLQRGIIEVHEKIETREVGLHDALKLSGRSGIINENPQNVTNEIPDKEIDKMEICVKEGKLGLQRGVIEVHEKIETREVGPHDTLKLSDRSGIINENPQNVTNELPDEETDKMEICVKEGKLGLQRGVIEVHEKIETREVGPHDTLKINDRSGIINENPQNVTNGRLDEENDKMEKSEKEGKLGLQRGVIELHEKIETREVCPHDTLKLSDRCGIINDGTVLKSRISLPSSTQVDECKVSTKKYQEISNHDVPHKNIVYTIANSTSKINWSLLNHMLHFHETKCTKTESCDRFDFNHLVKDDMSSEGYFENLSKADIKKTVNEVDNEYKTLKSVDWAAKSHLVSKTGIHYNETCSYLKSHSAYVYDTNKPITYCGNGSNTSTYSNLSSISFPEIVHSFEHLTSILNYISQLLNQKTTKNTCSFFKQNEIFADIRTDHSRFFSGEKVLNNCVEPFYELNKKIGVRGNNDGSNHDTFKPKLMFNGSPSSQNIDSLEKGEKFQNHLKKIQLQRCVNNTNATNFSIFFKGMRDQFLDMVVDHEEVVTTGDVEKEEPALFSYLGLRRNSFQQKCTNTKNTNSNLSKAGYGSDGDKQFISNEGVDFDSCQEHSEESTANPKRDLPIKQNVFELDAAVKLSPQRRTELRDKREYTTMFPFKHIFHSSDFDVTEKNQRSNSFEIKNLTFKKDQLNQDKRHDCLSVTKHFQEETNEEAVVSTVFSLRTNNIVEMDKTTSISKFASENLEYSDKISNFENKRSETEVPIIDLTSDEFDEEQCSVKVNENNETYVQRKSCIEYSYSQPRIDLSSSKRENMSQQEVILQAASIPDLNEEYSNDDDDIVVLYDSGLKSQYEDSNVHVNNGISFYDEDTILYVPNRYDENVVKDNTTINYTTELKFSNSFENSQQEQDILMEKNYSVEETHDECDSTMVDDEVQHEIKMVKRDLFTSYSLVFDARIESLCLEMGDLLFNKIKEEVDCSSLTPEECEHNPNNCQGSKQSDMASCGNNMFTHTSSFCEYFYDFYNTICSKNIDDEYQKFLIIVWFNKVYNRLTHLSKQKYSLSLAKKCLVKLFPQFSFEIPNVADFLRKDGKTLQRDCDVVRKTLREFKCMRINTTYQTN